jgi:hypothetical protein
MPSAPAASMILFVPAPAASVAFQETAIPTPPTGVSVPQKNA